MCLVTECMAFAEFEISDHHFEVPIHKKKTEQEGPKNMNTIFTVLSKKGFHEMATPQAMLKFADPNMKVIFKVRIES